MNGRERLRLARAQVRARHERMLAAAEDGPTYGTRWGGGAAALAPATAAAAGIGFAIAQGVLAAGFNVANQKFTLHLDQLDGTGLGGVLATANPRDTGSAPGGTGVLHAALASAKLSGLCVVVHQSLLGVHYSITVTAAGPRPSEGNNLFFDITDLTASPTELRGAVLGESADQVAVNGTGLGGSPGGFGLDVTRGSVSLHNVVASAYQTQIAGALTLPSLGINVKLGDATGCS